MFRCAILAAAYASLLYSSSLSSESPRPLPFSDSSYAALFRILKWATALGLLLEVNSILSRWAENRWKWTNGKGSWSWPDEIAVVTGGSKGIGAMVVNKLASHGITVVVLDVEPLSDEIESDKARLIHFLQCDITRRSAVHQAAEIIRSHHGCPSILINNAGIGNANSILEVTPERLRTIFDVNLLSHWNTVQAFLPDMIAKRKGHIMANASLAAFMGLAGAVDYSASKAGLVAFHEGLTQELKHRYSCPQIKTSIVYPNWTRTRLIKTIQKGIKSMNSPILEPQYVADAMVKQILNAKSGQIILGPSLAASIRAFPMWLQELVRDRTAQTVIGNATTAVACAP